MTTVRTRLRTAISEKLVPALHSAGFRGPAKIDGNALLHEYRRSTDHGTHVLEVQLEKHQLPRFILNLYIEPPGGIDELMATGGTILAGTLKAKAGPTTRSWFRADRSWWERVVLRRSNTLENEAVDLCVTLLPEVEAWWSSRAASPHISSWPVTYAARSSINAAHPQR